MNAEECMPILSLSMLSYNFYTMTNVTQYNDWLLTQDQAFALAWHKRFLQVSQTSADTTWLLKAPWHMNHIDAILKIYPDARIIVRFALLGETRYCGCSLGVCYISREDTLLFLGNFAKLSYIYLFGVLLACWVSKNSMAC
jgi:hypothetical protein